MSVDGPYLGYTFHPSSDLQALGHPQVDVVLRPVPTQRHFDPESMRLGVVSDLGGIELLTVHHPWRGSRRGYRACAGRMIWRDRKDKTVGAFTFGGRLRITSKATHTTCALTSPAPIIHLDPNPASIPTLLAEWVDTQLAERRAAWVHDPEGFDKRLAATDPLMLYRACLENLEERVQDLLHHTPRERFLQLTRAVWTELQRVKLTEDRSLRLPSLAELL